MTAPDVTTAIAAAFSGAFDSHRRELTGFGAYTTPRISDATWTRLAVGLAPVLKQLAAEAAEDARTDDPR